MRKLLLLSMLLLACFSCQKQQGEAACEFVTVKDGRFYIGDQEYRYVGTNFWYGAILASEGQGGDRERLQKELDLMQEVGINNIRVLVGGDGPGLLDYQIKPTLQTEPGVYNDTILQGLDYLMAELERRDMKAVLYLNNAWEWSGGFGVYLEWAGAGDTPSPKDWDAFQTYHSQFTTNEKAVELAANHTRFIVSRTNTVTGRPYSESPALMAWELANEPRAFSNAPEVKEKFAEWIQSQAQLIKSIDPNHLVTTGSEGKYGCQVDLALFERIHAFPEIDYACIHVWPFNWAWLGTYVSTIQEAVEVNGPESVVESVDRACANTEAYIDEAYAIMQPLGKPMVLEEFGYPRDNYAIAAGSPTEGRDQYFAHVFRIIRDSGKIAGCNFWSWGGYAEVKHANWQPGDNYTGDPAQEEQGLNSVFAADSSTMNIIRKIAQTINNAAAEAELCARAKQELVERLHRLADGDKIAFAHQDDVLYGHSWAPSGFQEEVRSDVKSVCGALPLVIGFDLGHLERGDSASLDGIPFETIRREAIRHYEQGGIVTMSWHARSPVTGDTAWDISDSVAVRKVLEGDLMQDYYKRLAGFFLSLRTSDGRPVPVLFRPWHEMTGSWFWWGQALCSDEEYKALYRGTCEAMEQAGVRNLVYAFSTGAEPRDTTEFLRRYPGDDLVTVVGFDTYQMPNNRDRFVADVRRLSSMVCDVAKAHGKVAAICETGFESVPDPAWWTETLLPCTEGLPLAYVLVWRNAHNMPNHFYAPWPGQESEEDFRKFYKDERTVFLGDEF